METHTGFHRDWIQTAMYSTANDLIQQHMHEAATTNTIIHTTWNTTVPASVTKQEAQQMLR